MGIVQLTVNERDKTAEKAMNTQHFQTKRYFTSVLYTAVFGTKLSSLVVFMLLGSFMLQPFERTQAAEITAENNIATIDTSLATAEIPDEPVETVSMSDLSVVTEDSIEETATATSQIIIDEVPSTQSLITDSDLTLPTAAAITSETVIPDSDQTDQNAKDVRTPDESDAVGEDGASTTTETVMTSADTNTNTTTSSSTEESAVAVSTVTSDAIVQFNKSDCVAVSDGSFYCRTAAVLTDALKDGLYSKQDIDGDLEIFFVQKGIETQITHNLVDDAAPYFDSISNTIVWHRFVNDRYQIIAFDIDSGSESQLTNDTVNNMEPTRAGQFTVWQHWNNNNWDIMLFDGSIVTLLTDTPQHDIAPNIRSNLVMWNRFTDDNAQTIELYDLVTKEYTTIADTEGGALSNPRMVLVYETEFENGDVVTKGYDVATGEIAPLATMPTELPDELPVPDSTGETRALIQNKNPSKEETEVLTGPTLVGPDPGVPPTATATTLDLSASSTVSNETNLGTATAPAVNLDVAEVLGEMDLVISPFVTEAGSTSSVIIE